VFDPEQIAQTEKRFAARAPEREATEAKLARGEILEADDPERVRMRLERKGVPPELVSAAMAAGSPREVERRLTEEAARGRTSTPGGDAERRLIETPAAPPAPAPAINTLERIIGTSDLIEASFLTNGARVARSVCRIEIGEASGLVAGYGTGVMISPRLLLTNNHVLDRAGVAALSVAEFGYETGPDGTARPGVRYPLDPDAFFATDPKLDYSVVAVRDRSEDGQPLAPWAWVPLIAQQGKIIKGEMVNIVQHPGGEPKQVALRENQVIDLLDDFLHYRTDTAPGSSGSPVFNDEWEIVALHHSGVPAKNDQGQLLAIDGTPWTAAMGEQRLRWDANEGARVSRIVTHLGGQQLGDAARTLLDEALAGATPPTEAADAPGLAARPLAGRPDSVAPAATPPAEPAPAATVTAAGTRWTIPLQVSIQVGTPVPAATGEPAASDTLAEALDALRQGRARAYYDAAADGAARDAYYADLPKRLSAAKRYAALSDLLARTHARQLRYDPARRVYPWVDLQPNGTLRSIYTGETYDPATLIREDIRIERERATWLRERLGREATSGDAREAIDTLEAALPYNCEHAVPQSWFEHREPMRGDLHHLFACEARCNSFRHNTPYFEFPQFDEAVRKGCGMTEGNRFEPSHGKGTVARAVLYFLLRYPGEIARAPEEYDEQRLALLLGWHRQEPPGEYERHRNAAIFELSGNRNPLIDHPAWSSRIDFAAGLG
jgi:endonuclease I/V8-like Glu-specific endopeptidase